MEPLAFISDIHGNLEALERVLDFIDSLGVREIYSLGDIVGYGPDPNHCVETASRVCRGGVAGNHDWAVVGKTPFEDFTPVARQAAYWTRTRLHASHLEYLAHLPLTLTLGTILLVHASPLAPHQWDYIMDPLSASLALEGSPHRIIMVGHTHVPRAYRLKEGRIETLPFPISLEEGSRYLINVGSVGQPRDGDPRACCAILKEGEIHLERIPYPAHKTAEKIKERGLPPILGLRIQEGW